MKKGLIVISLGVVIIGFLVYVLFVSNYASNGSKIIDLDKMFNINGRVVDYGVYDNASQEDLMTKFNSLYIENLKKGEKTYFIVGNQDKMELLSYEEVVQGQISLIVDKQIGNSVLEIKESRFAKQVIPSENQKVKVSIGGEEYNFDLKENENIYFVVSEKI